MSRVGVPQLQKRLDGLIEFLNPHWDFVNCHMVNFLTDFHWGTFIPAALRNEIGCKEDLELAMEQLFWQTGKSTSKFPEWERFLSKGEQERLSLHSELLTNVDQLIDGPENATQLSIREFMSAKKCHEVSLRSYYPSRL